MRKIWLISLMLTVVLLFQCVNIPVAATTNAEDPSVSRGCRGIDATVPFRKLVMQKRFCFMNPPQIPCFMLGMQIRKCILQAL